MRPVALLIITSAAAIVVWAACETLPPATAIGAAFAVASPLLTLIAVSVKETKRK